MSKLKIIISVLFLFSFSLTQISYSQPFELVNAFPNIPFSNPMLVTHSNDGTNRIFVVERTGLIKVFQNDSNTSNYNIFLDVTDKINLNYVERGLLGLAFHPNYSSNGYFYIYYTRVGDGNLIINRYSRSASDPNKADSLSALPLMDMTHPNVNHNGGTLFFGLDGYLYSGTGDGGGSGDPNNRAQNTNDILGKILRIDVNSTSGGNNYGIPPANPYASGGGRPEIYTIGMRNPWRFTQDPVTGLIWCADVGQNSWEEVDLIQLGLNYGWRCYEGTHAYNTAGCGPSTNYVFPIKEYSSTGSECSITGGYVYRGLRRPELTGRYIYGDYCSGKIWKLKYENGNVTEDELVLTSSSSIYSFGIDQNNELYVCCSNNNIYRLNKSDIVGVNNNVSSIPSGYELEQNYPNPFNPETNITYSIPELSKVKLTIYNIQGKEIATLVNTTQLAGSYKINWNGKDVYGNNIPSGAYFYNLTAGNDFSQTRKMLMVK